MDLDEPEAVEVVPEQLAHTRLHTEDGLVSRGAEVHDTVVETCRERDTRVLETLSLALLNLGLGARSILNRERESLSLYSGVELVDTDLELLNGARLDLGRLDDTLNDDDRLSLPVSNPMRETCWADSREWSGRT